MKALLLALALAAPDAGTPCVLTVHRPSGKVETRRCAPEPKPPPKCSVTVQLPNGGTKTVPCKP